MANTCPACGALLTGKASCPTIFEEFLALEYTRPEYGKVHLLTVACYMNQHERYSDEALGWIEKVLQDVMAGVIPTTRIRQNLRADIDPACRTWKVNRQPDTRELPKIKWTMTIADVAAGNHDAESYCRLVRQWADATLREMKPLLSST